MAQSDILGLFMTPQQYEMQQTNAARERAGLFAGMTPRQRAEFGSYLAGEQFGQGLAGLLGAQDPQLAIISRRQALSQQIDPSNPESLMAAAQQAAQAGDQQFALTLADYARKAQSELALAQQRSREGRAASTPKELQIAAARAQTQDQIRELEALPASPERDRALQVARDTLAGLPMKTEAMVSEQQIARDLALEKGVEGSDAFNAAYRDELRRLTTKENKAKISNYGQILIDAGFTPGTPEFQAEMRSYAKAELAGTAKGKGPQIQNILPGQGKEGAKDIPGFRDKVIQTIDPFRKTVTSADQALQSIADAIKDGNFISFNAARTQLAKALGDSSLSRRDIEQAGGDPSILGGILDKTSTLFTGTPTIDTQRKIQSTLQAIRKVAIRKANTELESQKKIANRAGYDAGDVELIFNFPEFRDTPRQPRQTTKTLKSGKTVTIIED